MSGKLNYIESLWKEKEMTNICDSTLTFTGDPCGNVIHDSSPYCWLHKEKLAEADKSHNLANIPEGAK